MKKYLLVLIFANLIVSQIHSQCPSPGEIRLPSQSHIDAFIADFPNCQEIEGTLIIGQNIQPVATDINDISGLINLKRITGKLRIRELVLLESFNGLDNIQYVGDDLYIADNDLLRNLNVFSSLDTVGGDFSIARNDNIETLFESNSIKHIGGALIVEQNESIQSIEGFHNIKSLNGDLFIANCPLLTDLKGLEEITSVNGKLLIFNTGIAYLSELNNVEKITGGSSSLNIANNPNLINLSGLEKLDSIEGHLLLNENPQLESLSALSSLEYLGGLLDISETAIEDLNGLENVTVGLGRVEIDDNPNLVSINQLKLGNSIDGSLSLHGNDALTDIDVLSSVDSVFNGLVVSSNSSLSNCKSICGLLSEGFIDGAEVIANNDVGCNSRVEIIGEGCTTNTTDIDVDLDGFRVFPNPVLDVLYIEPTDIANNSFSLTLLNSLGKTIEKIENPEPSTRLNINMSLHESGFYYLVIQSEKSKKIIKVLKI